MFKTLITGQKILSGHDISDGGLITCFLEMAFGGYCGINVYLDRIKNVRNVNDIEILFAEECGWVLEVCTSYVDEVIMKLNVPVYLIGTTTTYGNTSRV